MGTQIKKYGNIFYNSYTVEFDEDYEECADEITNTDYGKFTKEELFWAIYEKVLIPSGLYSYENSPYDDKVHLHHIVDEPDGNTVGLFLEFVDINEGYNFLHDVKNTPLDDVLRQFFNLLKGIYTDIDKDYPIKLDLEKSIKIPKSDEDILRQLKIKQYNQ